MLSKAFEGGVNCLETRYRVGIENTMTSSRYAATYRVDIYTLVIYIYGMRQAGSVRHPGAGRMRFTWAK